MNGRNDNYGRSGQYGSHGRGSEHRNDGNSLIEKIRQEVPVFLDPQQDPEGEKLVEYAEKLGRHLAANRMTTSQVRNLFSAAKRIDYTDKKGPYEKNLLRAQFAYNAGRFSEVRDFQRVADKALECIKNGEQFTRFINFFEAVVAYHKAAGGKE